MSKNISELSGRQGLDNNLFERLGKAAEASGTPDPAHLQALAEEFLIGKANVYGSTTFYDFLRPENQGKKIYVCNGSACRTAGTQPALHHEVARHFAADEIGEMCCLGRCHENSAFHLGGQNFSGNDLRRLHELKHQRTPTSEHYHVACSGVPVLTAPTPAPQEYFQLLLKAFEMGPQAVLESIKASGLRGRGGAGFPIGFKLDGCRQSPGDKKFIVCNADEGDPGAYSDRYLMEQRPYAVLLGMMLAGFTVGADTGVLYIRGEYPESITATENAIQWLQEHGWLGYNIQGSDFHFRFKVIRAQGAYICGEETALLSSIEGQRPEVRVRPPYPTQQGLFNKPTVVNNVETLGALPWILQEGGEAYSRIGKGKSTGTKLVSLDGHFRRPGIYEVDMGTPLEKVVHELGMGFRHPVKAMHIGGPLGGLVPVHKIPELSVDFESFAAHGFLLGHASVVCLPQEYPMIDYLEHLFSFTAHESCGKCFPCRLGSTRGAEMLRKAREGTYQVDATLMADLLDTLEQGSLCALGGGLPLPVRNALQYFKEELQPYFSPLPAG